MSPAPSSVHRAFSEHLFSPLVAGPPPSSRAAMDAAVERVASAASLFAALSLAERIDLVDRLALGVAGTAAAVVAVSCRAKGIVPGSLVEGEEWATGPVPVLRQLRLLRESLVSLQVKGDTLAGPVDRAFDGRLRARVFPANRIDALILRDVSIEVRLEGSMDETGFAERRASFYRGGSSAGGTALVLGGGNIASVAPMDILTKLFVEGRVCLLKMNPVNAYLGPLLETAFSAALEKGFLAILYGGAEEGAYLCRHRHVGEIHVTGSDSTHDAIVGPLPPPGSKAGPGQEGSGLDKRITSELGNVSPVIVVPGEYSRGEIRYQADDVAGAATMNSSCLCSTPKIIVSPRGWKGREPFLRSVEEALARLPSRLAFYPGTSERWERITTGRRGLKTYGGPGQGRLPWAFVDHLDPDAHEDLLFTEEAFAPVIAEVGVGSDDPLDFLEEAVSFVNERLWGTLSATLVVHPKTLADPVTALAVEKAVARLRYGTVSLNAFPWLSYGLASPPWGGFPGSTVRDIQSGRGWVHNTSMLEGVEKVILRHPLTTFPRPAYHPRHRGFRALMRRMSLLETHYSWTRLPGVLLAALQR